MPKRNSNPPQPRLCKCGCGGIVTSKDKRIVYLFGHAARDKSIQQKIKDTCLKKYGVDNAAKCSIIQEKMKKTTIERYGVDNAAKSEIIKNKIKNTCIQHYGVDHPTKSPQILQKISDTTFKNHGVKYGVNLTKDHSYLDPQHMITKTLEKYGSYSCVEISNKKKSTCISKYGVEFVTQSESIKQKIKSTVIQKYGVDNVAKSDICKSKFVNTIKQSMWERLINNPIWQPMFTYDEFKGWGNWYIGLKTKYKFKCKKCGHIQEFSEYLNGCRQCNYKIHRSSMEDELYNILKQKYSDIIINDKNIIYPKELDIYIPSKKLAIEFDGLYWHSNLYITDPKYHLSKTNMCNNKGIRLIHVFEDEWIFYKNDVVAKIISILENKENDIEQISINLNHVQKYNTEEYKILKLDRRWENLNHYINKGFKLDYISEPFAWCTKDNKRVSIDLNVTHPIIFDCGYYIIKSSNKIKHKDYLI